TPTSPHCSPFRESDDVAPRWAVPPLPTAQEGYTGDATVIDPKVHGPDHLTPGAERLGCARTSRRCLKCGKAFTGRPEKRFCQGSCRARFHRDEIQTQTSIETSSSRRGRTLPSEGLT